MSRYIGNYLRVPSSEPQQASAPGIWSLSEQLNYQRANLWPPARDPYYNQTVLHLSGDVAGTKETNPVTQPRTFLSDASTNNFLLTPYGDVSARPFSPYASSYSNFFSGSGQYLTATNSSAFYLSTGNFTVEAWVYKLTTGIGIIVSQTQNTSVPYAGWLMYVTSGNLLKFEGSNGVNIQASVPFPINQWVHVAAVRVGSTTTLYMDGSAVATGSVSITDFSGLLTIGQYTSAFSGPEWNGYISNLRIVKGTAVYTSSFTPPTQPLQNISGTSLLTCQSNRFRDVSSSGFTITPNGSPAVAQNSPFVDYDTTSGSGYFNGSTGYLTWPGSAIGTSPFCFECWFYPTSIGAVQTLFGNNSTSSGSISVRLITSTRIDIDRYNVASSQFTVPTMAANQWFHLVACRDTLNNTTIFLNGIRSSTGTISDSYNYGNVASVGYLNSAFPQMFGGNIAAARLVVGSTPYDPTQTNITIPTTPLTSVTNTQLLTLQTRAPANNQGILDTGPNSFVVTRTGNVAQGSFSPFSQSGWSNYFDGNGDQLTSASTANLNLNLNNNWTIEGWFYKTGSFGNTGNFMALGTGGSTLYWQLAVGQTGGAVTFGAGSGGWDWATSPIGASSAINLNQWHHVAYVRNGASTLLIFIDGIVRYTNTSYNFGSATQGGTLFIGSYFGNHNNDGSWFSGYVSNLRIVNGQSLYTSNFTPSTSSLTTTSQGAIASNIALLTSQSNRFIDNSTSARTLTRSGDISVQPFSPFAPTQAYVASQLGGSAYFDSSGDSLTVPSAPALNMTGDFCMEAWAYPTTAGISFAWKYTAGVVSTSEYFWAIDGTNQLSVALDGGGGEDYFRTAANTITLNAWNHCVITRVGTAVRQFINGVLQSYNTTSRTLNTTSTNFSTSANSGYISGLRIMRGSIPDMYQTTATTTGTTIFTPPTTPVISVPGTSLLYNFTGAGIVDASGKHTIETVGNAHKSTAQARFTGTGADYYDGTSDYLTIRDNPLLELGSANFTIEAWVYPLNNSSRSIFGHGPDGQNWWAFYLDGTGKLEFAIVSGNSTVVDRISSTTVNTNTWTHVAVTRSGSTFRLFIDGQEPASYTGSPATTSAAAPDFSTDFWIGGQRWSGSGNSFQGYIQDLRVTRGVARYTSNFTPLTRTLELG